MQMNVRRSVADAFVALTFALALAIPIYVAFRDDRRVRSAYVGWRSGDFVYETSVAAMGWRLSFRADVPRRVRFSDGHIPRGGDTLNGPGSYWPDRFAAGFDSYPLTSLGEAPGENPSWQGFGGGRLPSSKWHHVHTAWVPVWFVSLVLALPGLRVMARMAGARRRRDSGCCVNCGYDLRGGHERCPECGADAITRP
ncbi:MAG TPA: hypothetical protein VGR35_16220 [Tepidisphaeraceae bacterium]|nr:hypothetical protein [Tepidisphaeraceae bacterium]